MIVIYLPSKVSVRSFIPTFNEFEINNVQRMNGPHAMNGLVHDSLVEEIMMALIFIFIKPLTIYA